MSETIYSMYHPHIEEEIMVSPNAPLFIGLECEIESVCDVAKGHHNFKIEQDGSLRNSGVEFISPPITSDQAVPQFKKLHSVIQYYKKADAFTARTSIHVHANCANLEDVEVRNIVYMYALFEEVFFMLCSPVRRSNIHCTPLTETYLPSFYKHQLPALLNKWHKYTALNIKPLSKQGTIEFRHMHGHDDAELLGVWIKAIERLIECGRNNPINKHTLTMGNIQEWFQEIFGHTKYSFLTPTLPTLLANSILDIKLAVL